MEVCAYYDAKTAHIQDILPKDTDEEFQQAIMSAWQQPISQRILKALSVHNNMTLSQIAEELGHSASTIHENVKKLERIGLLSSSISYEKKKQRIISTNVLFATKSPRFKEALSKFFQGLWINSQDMNTIVSFLESYPDNKFTVEQISAATTIPIHRVEIALSNWDSVTTRGLSQLSQNKPFVKEVTYQSKK